jgi:hypothetical protein
MPYIVFGDLGLNAQKLYVKLKYVFLHLKLLFDF